MKVFQRNDLLDITLRLKDVNVLFVAVPAHYRSMHAEGFSASAELPFVPPKELDAFDTP